MSERQPIAGDDMVCGVCGLEMRRLPPIHRFMDAHGKMVCGHFFGIPAKDVPNWKTHNPDGTPYVPPLPLGSGQSPG